MDKNNLYTLNDAWVAWENGEKFPIAFFGDSTFDGDNTTEWIPNELGKESKSKNAFSKHLENLIREATNNDVMRVYNAGFAGQTLSWGYENIEKAFGDNSDYKDTKMVGIGFGINDRLDYKSYKQYRENFKKNLIDTIKWFKDKGIQPFLLTSQAIISPGVKTEYIKEYPLRTACSVSIIANEVKREIAEEENLEIIDLNYFTEKYLLYSKKSLNEIISDKLHFGDVGHAYEAGLIFKEICPRVIEVKESCKIDYSNQKVLGVAEDWISFCGGDFKLEVNTTKSNFDNTKIFDAYIFIESNREFILKGYCEKAHKSYAKINDEIISLNNKETYLGELDLGLYHIEVFTGDTNKVDFKGVKLK